MTRAFHKLWLRADTYIAGLHPYQNRQVRKLCERFFEKGRQFERERLAVVPSPDNPLYSEDENGQS